MYSLSSKEKATTIIFGLFAIVFLALGVYDYLFHNLPDIDLINHIAVSMILTGFALAPKTFFTPLGKLLSPIHKVEALVNYKLQQTILYSGLVISLLCTWFG